MAKITTITNPLTGQPAQVDQLEHTAQEIDDAIARALPGGYYDKWVSQLPGQNLLDNWYFGNPVDQRGGYVVYEGTTLYADASCTTAVGTVAGGPYQGYAISGICVSFVSNDTYYVKKADCVRGYTGAGYGPDRWMLYQGNPTVLITNDGIKIIGNSGGRSFSQIAETGLNETITISALVTEVSDPGTDCGYLWIDEGNDNPWVRSAITAPGLVTLTAPKNTFSSGTKRFHVFVLDGKNITIKAVKLELGNHQTLAHQENGVWVLNEIPNYGEQLARCQRYFQTFATESLRHTDALDFRPVMRANPALSTITVGGKTLYTANADL